MTTTHPSANDSGLNLDHLEALATIPEERALFAAALKQGWPGVVDPNDDAYWEQGYGMIWRAAVTAALANQPAPDGMSTALAEVTEKLSRMSAENLSLGMENMQLREQLADTNQPVPVLPAQESLVRQIHKAVLNLKPNPALTKKEQHEVLGAIHCCAGIVSGFAHQPAQEQADDLPPLTMSVYGTKTVLELERQRRADIAAQAAQQEPVAAPDRKLDAEAIRAIRRAVRYLEENDCTGPAEDLKALLATPAAQQEPVAAPQPKGEAPQADDVAKVVAVWLRYGQAVIEFTGNPPNLGDKFYRALAHQPAQEQANDVSRKDLLLALKAALDTCATKSGVPKMSHLDTLNALNEAIDAATRTAPAAQQEPVAAPQQAAAPGALEKSARALAEKWHRDAVDTGFATSEAAVELLEVLDAAPSAPGTPEALKGGA